ncbi:beta-catenin binding [Homalodisca vitripennis]|nr:beta-catenin binding [Homalodisca vitripennis]
MSNIHIYPQALRHWCSALLPVITIKAVITARSSHPAITKCSSETSKRTLLAVDGGEGRYYNETWSSSTHHWLLVDKQERVYAGGKAEYTGVRTFDVKAEFHEDDVRLDSRILPLPPAINRTQWGQATMARNLDKFCPSNSSCTNTVCPDPFQCVDIWHEYECS